MAYLPYGCNIFEGPFDHDLENSFTLIPRTGFSGPWSLPRQSSSTEAEPKSFRFDAKGFTGWIDVHLFEPREISVKTINHTIVVECNHDSRPDSHGPSVERHFVRKFNLPSDYDMTLVKSTLSNDGILQLEAPKPELQGEEREVQVLESEKPSLIMSLLSNRAHSLLKKSHSIPSDEEDCYDAV